MSDAKNFHLAGRWYAAMRLLVWTSLLLLIVAVSPAQSPQVAVLLARAHAQEQAG